MGPFKGANGVQKGTQHENVREIWLERLLVNRPLTQIGSEDTKALHTCKKGPRQVGDAPNLWD